MSENAAFVASAIETDEKYTHVFDASKSPTTGNIVDSDDGGDNDDIDFPNRMVTGVVHTALRAARDGTEGHTHIALCDFEGRMRVTAVAARVEEAILLSATAELLSTIEAKTGAPNQELQRRLRSILTHPSLHSLHLVLRLRGAGDMATCPSKFRLQGSQDKADYSTNIQLQGLSLPTFMGARFATSDMWNDAVYGEEWGALRQRGAQGSPMQALCVCADVIKRSPYTFRTPIGNEPLVEDAYVSVGKVTRRRTYQALFGALYVQTHSGLRPNPAPIELTTALGITPGGVAAHLSATNSVQLRGYTVAWGLVAHHNLVTDMMSSNRVRKWALSAFIRGSLLVCTESTVDGFIPTDIQRVKDYLKLERKIPLSWFEPFGGCVASMGDVVVFKSYKNDAARVVLNIDETGKMQIGKTVETAAANPPKVVYLWKSESLHIGRADSSQSPTVVADFTQPQEIVADSLQPQEIVTDSSQPAPNFVGEAVPVRRSILRKVGDCFGCN